MAISYYDLLFRMDIRRRGPFKFSESAIAQKRRKNRARRVSWTARPFDTRIVQNRGMIAQKKLHTSLRLRDMTLGVGTVHKGLRLPFFQYTSFLTYRLISHFRIRSSRPQRHLFPWQPSYLVPALDGIPVRPRSQYCLLWKNWELRLCHESKSSIAQTIWMIQRSQSSIVQTFWTIQMRWARTPPMTDLGSISPRNWATHYTTATPWILSSSPLKRQE